MSGTVIDELVLELGLDGRNFTKEQKELLSQLRELEEESLKGANRAERNAKNLTDMFASFRREAIGALGVFLGGRGVMEFTNYITGMDANVGRLAQTMNMSAREIAAWQGAARAAGGTGEGVTGTLQAMTQDMNRFMLTGQGTLAQMLRPLGIGLFDVNGRLKTAGELMEELAAAAQHMDPARFSAFFGMLPGANQESLNLLINGRDELRRILEAQRQLNNVTPESIRLAKQYQEVTVELDTSMTSFGRNLAVLVLPAITSVTGALGQLFAKWNVTPGSAEDKAQSSALRDKLVSRFGSPRAILEWIAGNWPIGDPKETLALADKLYGPKGQDERDAAKTATAGATTARSIAQGGTNWTNFLSGLSYLETSHQNVGNNTSSAQGYFQFLKGTAKRATDAGIPDPRYGSYDEQSDATKRYIERFYPKAAEAIARGDYQGAEQMLKGEWPSLPGGIQQQTPARYSTYRQTLQGNQSTSNSSTKTVQVGSVIVHTQAKDAEGIGRDIKPVLERGETVSQFNTGAE
ncbi:hypothetical protein H8A95_16015 [Bradyrhizobium sp. Pear76]|uniref:hypothetical protein n=1 Tax=Bradyrhizobium oropedii TaxID=1571201 RepID=UPI001E34A4D8|nr:hypothetical protein [Bradyrhizobium oropedii]MCC8963777.1 hypothetical protein [Bradyrhizobium oropedii]